MEDEIERLRSIAIERMDLFRQAANDAERLAKQITEMRNAGNQALRQWKMYAESHDPEDDFEKSAEGAVYLACKAILTTGQ